MIFSRRTPIMATTALTRWRTGGVAVVLFGALLWTLLTAGNSVTAPVPVTLPADLTKIPSDAVFLASVRLADLWKSDFSRSIRQKYDKEINEVASREFESRFGLPINQVERLTLVGLKAIAPEELLFFVSTVKAYDRDKVIAAGEKGKEENYKGQTFYVKGKDWAVYPLDKRALVYGKPSDIRGLIDHPAKANGNLAASLRLAAGKHAEVYAVNVKAINNAFGARLPGEAASFKPLLQAQYGTLTVDMDKEIRADVQLMFAGDQDAKAAVEPACAAVDLARTGLQRAVDELSKQKEMSGIIGLLKQLDESLAAVQVKQRGKALQASVVLKVDVANMGVQLVEAVQKVREAANRLQAMNNLKQLALAMMNYAAQKQGQLPTHAIYSKDGKPLLSWRVTILPYIERKQLYKEFHLDEPWDSAHNKKLLARMPEIYASPQDHKTLKEHTTYYQGFVGNGAFFQGKQGLRFPASITDGTSNTIMFVEASKAVPWTKPEDVPYDPAKPLPKLGLPDCSYTLAVLCDGSVRPIAPGISEMTLHSAITTSGGEILGADW
jgi:uncharacterized protein DUF1559